MNITWQHILGREKGPGDKEQTALRNRVCFVSLFTD